MYARDHQVKNDKPLPLGKLKVFKHIQQYLDQWWQENKNFADIIIDISEFFLLLIKQ